MPNEKKTDAQPSETVEEMETLETNEVQTDEAIETPEVNEDVEKQEGFYEQELAKLRQDKTDLEVKLAKKDKQIEIKDRAIQAEKKKNKELPEGDIDSLLEAKLLERDAKAFAKSLIPNKAEYELTMHHYNHGVQKTGDYEQDIINARALANAKRINELLSQSSVEEELDEASVSSMNGGYSRPKQSKIKSFERKELERLLPKEKHKFIKVQ